MEQKKLDYILSHFFSVYDVPNLIKKELASSTCLVTWPDVAGDFFEREATNPPTAMHEILGKTVAVLFPEGTELKTIVANRVQLGFDWAAACFYFLSGYQDWITLGNKSRFYANDALQYQIQVHRLPLVNYYFEMLRLALAEAYETDISLHSQYPSLFLSHDIDNLNRGWLEGGWAELKSLRLISAIRLVFKRLIGHDDWNNLNIIKDVEMQLGVRSTFFFLAKKDKENADYDVTRLKYQKSIRELAASGFEIGIHGSKGSHGSAPQLGTDLSKIKAKVYGNRFHYLYFNPKSSYQALEMNKIKYDSSMGFFDEVGFRHAYCYPFRLWHFEEDRPVAFLELPLNVMDTTLAKKKYIFAGQKASLQLIEETMAEIAKFNGTFSLLWHNNYFSDYKYNGWQEVYKQSVKSALKMGFKSKTGFELWESFAKKNVQ